MRNGKRALSMLLCLFMLVSLFPTMAFADGTVLRLPAGTRVMEEEAFAGDSSLDKVILPNSLEQLGPRAFAGSSLRQINLPASLAEGGIADDAFDAAPLRDVIVEPDTPAGDWARAHQAAFGY